MNLFPYGQTELDYLSQKDKRLGAVIERFGMIERSVNPDLFSALVSSIISQQISNQAAKSVHARFVELLGKVTPQRLARFSAQEIQRCGMSMRKAGYIKGIGDAALDGSVDFDALRHLPDEEVIRTLSALRGVGVWTAEMLLIFSLCRPDVVSYGDLAIRRGIMTLYKHKELGPERFARYKKRYSPYGSVASLYLWELSHIDEMPVSAGQHKAE